MVVTIYKYTIETNLTKKREKTKKKKTRTQTNGMYLSKLVIKQGMQAESQQYLHINESKQVVAQAVRFNKFIMWVGYLTAREN